MRYTLSSIGFPDIGTLFSYLFLKVFIVIPLLFFFFETKKWWKYALLIPIVLTIFQIKTALDPNLVHLDSNEMFEAAPFLVLVLLVLLLLSNTAYYQSKMKQLYQGTYDRLELVIQKRFRQRELFLTKSKDKWEALQKKQDLEEEELLQLKQHLEQELQKQP
ncbi:MAG: hypothetical protein AAF717_17860 [Bacteroidota bacterium]